MSRQRWALSEPDPGRSCACIECHRNSYCRQRQQGYRLRTTKTDSLVCVCSETALSSREIVAGELRAVPAPGVCVLRIAGTAARRNQAIEHLSQCQELAPAMRRCCVNFQHSSMTVDKCVCSKTVNPPWPKRSCMQSCSSTVRFNMFRTRQSKFVCAINSTNGPGGKAPPLASVEILPAAGDRVFRQAQPILVSLNRKSDDDKQCGQAHDAKQHIRATLYSCIRQS